MIDENLKKQVSYKKLKFEDCKNCLVVTQLENKIIHLEKKRIDVNCVKGELNEFNKKKKLISKI